jgi:hypothetical protein
MAGVALMRYEIFDIDENPRLDPRERREYQEDLDVRPGLARSGQDRLRLRALAEEQEDAHWEERAEYWRAVTRGYVPKSKLLLEEDPNDLPPHWGKVANFFKILDDKSVRVRKSPDPWADQLADADPRQPDRLIELVDQMLRAGVDADDIAYKFSWALKRVYNETVIGFVEIELSKAIEKAHERTIRRAQRYSIKFDVFAHSVGLKRILMFGWDPLGAQILEWRRKMQERMAPHSIGTVLHDFIVWQPKVSGNDAVEWLRFLWKHKDRVFQEVEDEEADDDDDDNEDSLAELKVIAKQWAKLTPKERKMPIADLIANSYTKSYEVTPGCEALAATAAKYGYDPDDYTEIESGWLHAKEHGPWLNVYPVPDIQIESDGLVVRRLDHLDPLTLFAGDATDCCQHPDGAGESCAWHALHENSCVVGVFEGKDMIAQGWTWRAVAKAYVPGGGGIDGAVVVLDNIEVKAKRASKAPQIKDAVTAWAREVLAADSFILDVRCGRGDVNFVSTPYFVIPCPHDTYTDAESQTLVASSVESFPVDALDLIVYENWDLFRHIKTLDDLRGVRGIGELPPQSSPFSNEEIMGAIQIRRSKHMQKVYVFPAERDVAVVRSFSKPDWGEPEPWDGVRSAAQYLADDIRQWEESEIRDTLKPGSDTKFSVVIESESVTFDRVEQTIRT